MNSLQIQAVNAQFFTEDELSTAWRLLIHIRNALNRELTHPHDKRTGILIDQAIAEVYDASSTLENIPGVAR